MIKLLNLDRLHLSLKPELDEAIAKVIESSEFLGGCRGNPFVQQFEQELADYVGVKHCVGVGSGTDAIRIVLIAAGMVHSMFEAQDVYVPVNTAYPAVEAVVSYGVHTGGRVNFVDCDPTYTIDTSSFKVPYQGEIVMVNHQYGHPCDMDAVDMWGDHPRFTLEDCSHAHGAKYKGQNVGTFGDAAVFSFNSTKILGAMGDAGCIVTDDDDLAQICRQLADHGRREKYTHDHIGWNSRMDGIQAAVLSVKLKYLGQWVERRRRIAEKYFLGIDSSNVVLSLGPSVESGVSRLGIADGVPAVESRWAFLSDEIYHSYHQFVIRVKNRDQVRAKLLERGIQTGIHYPLSLPEQPALQYLGYDPDDFIATRLSKEILSLPINESMTDKEVEIVCEGLKKTLDET